VTAPEGATVRDGGYALAGPRPPTVHTGSGWARVARPDGLTSVMLALHGFRDAAVARALDANAFGACSATPYLTAPGGTGVYVSLVVLTGDRVDPEALHASIRVAVNGDLAGDRVTVRFPDGERVELTARGYARYPADGGTPVHWLDSGQRGVRIP
jgi:hypothetical protein